jgi:hypothetical protein
VDYESVDREMSGWYVETTNNGIRLWLTRDGYSTDILERAQWFRWQDDAEAAARRETTEHAYAAFRVVWYAKRTATVRLERLQRVEGGMNHDARTV